MNRLLEFIVPLLLWSAMVQAQSQSELLLLPSETNSTQRELLWSTDPGIRYELQSSTNLNDWITTAGFPTMAAALAQQQLIDLQAAQKLFFRVLALDEQPPVITPQSPAANAFAVPRFSAITVALSDVSGIDPASISMTVDGLGTYTLASSKLSFTNGVLTFYNGGDTALGGYGSNVQVSVTVADVNGNSTDYAWWFDLEVEAVVDSNLFIFGSPAAQRAGQQIGAIATRVLADRMNGGPIRMSGADPWTLDSVNASAVIVAYTGDTPPSFPVGAFIANLTPATVNDIFYRKVTGIYNDAANKKLTLFTQDAALTDIVTEGTAAISENSVVFEVSTNGAIVRALSGNFAVSLPAIGFSLDNSTFKVDDSGWQVTSGGTTFSYGSPPAGGWSSGASLEMGVEECHFWLYPKLETSFEITAGRLKRFTSIARGNVESALIAQVDVKAGISYEKTIFDLPDSANPRTTIFLGTIGVIPVFAEVRLDMKVDLDLSSKAQLQFRYGLRKSFSSFFGVQYGNDEFNWVDDFDEKPTEPIATASFSGEVEIGLTLKPSLSVLVYRLAGIETGPAVRGGLRARIESSQTTGYLTGKADWDIGLAGPAFASLNPQPSLSLGIWDPTDWKLFPTNANITFTKQPASKTTTLGGSVTLECSVSANQEVSYQWYQNNLPLVGKTSRTLTLSPVAYGHDGIYKVRASAGGQFVDSDAAVLSVLQTSGMVRILRGTNAGIDPELGAYSLTVSTFYMDKTEVTKAQWDAVYSWAVAHGYNFDNTGSAGDGERLATHPVHTVNWYDCVKWCNARSEKEGRAPVYSVVGQSVYRTGRPAPYTVVVQNTEVDGYRLPTGTEWEYAARGGLSGQLFPWGKTIQHRLANYCSLPGCYYDTSSTRLYHPAYYDKNEPYPYTSPAGSFYANGYGLYDMAGNISEWCWDVSNENKSCRELRGGCWMSFADQLLCGAPPVPEYPGGADVTTGFRTVRR